MSRTDDRKLRMRRLFARCGALVLLLAIVVAGFSIWGSGTVETKPHHPFRSAEAKERYLKFYDLKAAKWPVPSEERVVRTSFGETFVRISGPADAPPLVLLHGINGNSLQWMPNIEALSAGFRVYAVDNIYDCGRSVYTGAITSSAEYMKWLDELFDGLRLGRHVNLAGLSYGGWLAAQYALDHPDRLEKVVLLAPVCTVLPLSYEWIGRAVLCAVPHPYFTKSFLSWLLEDLGKTGTGRAAIQEHADESYLALRSFKSKRMVNPTVLLDGEWQGLKVPALFIVGENEKIYSAQDAVKRLNAVAPQIRTEIIPRAGHDLTIVQAELVNKRVVEFLKR